MQQKIKDILNKISDFVNLKFKHILSKIDLKASELIPNPKVKKIAYIAFVSLFGFMFLIIIIGILVSPLRNTPSDNGIVIKKPNTIVSTPEPQKELSDTQKELLKLENQINLPDQQLKLLVEQIDGVDRTLADLNHRFVRGLLQAQLRDGLGHIDIFFRR